VPNFETICVDWQSVHGPWTFYCDALLVCLNLIFMS